MLGESPYSEEVSLGRLKTGDYQIAFTPDEDQTSYRTLHIDVAKVSATDEMNYARVSNLNVPDVVIEGQPARVTISGVYASPCDRLMDPMLVQKQGDTFVIRPVEVKTADCNVNNRTYDKTLDLGVLTPGEYLIHVRSSNGKAVEKTLLVLKTH